MGCRTEGWTVLGGCVLIAVHRLKLWLVKCNVSVRLIKALITKEQLISPTPFFSYTGGWTIFCSTNLFHLPSGMRSWRALQAFCHILASNQLKFDKITKRCQHVLRRFGSNRSALARLCKRA